MSEVPDPALEAPVTTGLAGRVSVSVIDQALSSGTNVLITLVAARELGAHDFGTFGLAYLLAILIGGAARSTIGGTILVFQDDAARDDAREPFGSALGAGLLGGLVLAGAGLVGGGDIRMPLLALAVTLPGLLVQDAGRIVEFALLRPGRALALDALWAVAMVVGLVGVEITGELTAVTTLLVWGLSGTLSGLWCLWQHGRRLPPPSLAWLRRTWPFAWRYFVTFASTLGVAQLTGVVLGVVAGVTAVGAVRASQVVFGPIQNLSLGMMVALVPETTVDTPLRDQRKRLLGASLFLSIIAGAMTAAVLLVPDEVGEAFLGDTWESARQIMLPAGVMAALLGVMTGATIGLRAARAVHESLIVGLQLSALQLVIPIAAAVAGDEQGYMWALAATYAIGCLMWWRRYLHVEAHGPGPQEFLS